MYQTLRLTVDRDTFDALKELLQRQSSKKRTSLMSAGDYMERRRLQYIYDQIRDVKYDDLQPLVSLNYE
jgi:hypothetical protein